MASPGTCSTQHRLMKILVSIYSKLSKLIESNAQLSSFSDDLSILLPPSNASVCLNDVCETGESLIQVAKECINKTEDRVVSGQMKQASEHLQEAVDKVYQLSVNVNSAKNSAEVYQQLVLASNHLLQYTFQIFFIAKESELKNLSDVATRVKNKASMLKWNTTNTETLTKYFKELTEELLLLNKLCMQRHKELVGEQQQKELIVNGLQIVRMIFLSLQEALKTCLAKPNDKQAKTIQIRFCFDHHLINDVIMNRLPTDPILVNRPGVFVSLLSKVNRDFLIHRIITAVSLLNDVIMNRLPTDPILVNRPGVFVSLLSKIINGLSERNRVVLCDDFESWLYSSIQHAMCVSHFIPKERKELVVNVCLKVLEAQRNVYSFHQKITSDVTETLHKNAYNSWCSKLIDSLCHLEIRINKEVLHLLISVFAETSEPLERLVDPILFPESSDCNVKKLASLKEFFHNHLDNVWNVARFVAASSHKVKRVREIEIAIHNFECLDAEISSLISLKIQELSNHSSIRMSDAAIIQLKILMKEWQLQISNLVTLLDLTIDPQLFLAVSAKRLNDELTVCYDLADARPHDFKKLLCLSRSIRAKTARISQFLTNIKKCENLVSHQLYKTQIIEKIEKVLLEHKIHHKSLKEAANSKELSKFNIARFLESSSFLIQISVQATNVLCSPDNSNVFYNSMQFESLVKSSSYPLLNLKSLQSPLVSLCSSECGQVKSVVDYSTSITKQLTLTTPTIHWTELTSILTHPHNDPWLESLPSPHTNSNGSLSDVPHNTLV